MLIIKGVNLYPSEVEAALLGVEDLQPHYLLVVDRRATLARLEVQVEPAPALLARCGGFQADHPACWRAAAAAWPSGCARSPGSAIEVDARGAPTRSRARRARPCGSIEKR